MYYIAAKTKNRICIFIGMLKTNDKKLTHQVLTCHSSPSVVCGPGAQASPPGGQMQGRAEGHWPAILTCHLVSCSSYWSYTHTSFPFSPLSPPLSLEVGKESGWVLCKKTSSSMGQSYSTEPRWGWQVQI